MVLFHLFAPNQIRTLKCCLPPPPEPLNQLFFISSGDALLPAVAVHLTCGVVAAAECVCCHLACSSIFEDSQPALFEVLAVAAEAVSRAGLVQTEVLQTLELLAGVVHLAAQQGDAGEGLHVLTAEESSVTRHRLNTGGPHAFQALDPPVEQRTAGGLVVLS